MLFKHYSIYCFIGKVFNKCFDSHRSRVWNSNDHSILSLIQLLSCYFTSSDVTFSTCHFIDVCSIFYLDKPLWLSGYVVLHLLLKYGVPTLARLSGGTLRQVGLPSRATASNSCRENIGLSELSPDSTLYRKVGETRGILSFIDYQLE
jgi:hypothetical protein